MNREDFPMFKNTDIVYFDNAATTFKPYSVLDSMNKYYNNYSANAHRGDYKISLIVDTLYESVRENVREFINAKKAEEIVFTYGTTDSMNILVNGFFEDYLTKGDGVLITKSEHASNILPWYKLRDKLNIDIDFIELDSNYRVTIDNLLKAIKPNTKVISIAQITNVIGDLRPIKEIVKIAHEKGIIVVVDGAQGIAHMNVDVTSLDVDFYTFSAHKMCGPTGVGILYGKHELLDKVNPLRLGGGMNISFDSKGEIEFKELPYKLEAGTPNIANIIGFGEAINYLKNIGMDKIHKHEINLRKYLINEMIKLDNIEIYNKDSDSGVVSFNIKGVFSQDTALYLDKYNICVRAGNHCAKILKEELGVNNTCRISLYFYNTKEEVDKLITVLKNSKNLYNEII